MDDKLMVSLELFTFHGVDKKIKQLKLKTKVSFPII